MRLVAFDIDDTLYLERDYVRSGFAAAEEASGIVGLAAACLDLFRSGARGSIFDQALRGLGHEATSQQVAQLVSEYRGHDPAIRLLPDAETALADWRGEAFLGVVSDGPLASQAAKVRALRLDALVDSIVLTATLGPGRGKPDPAGFILLEQAAGVSGDACVYVADNPVKDFRAPHQRGWRTIRVRRLAGLHHAVTSGVDVDDEVATLNELSQVLSRRPPRRG
jgi:putative hydrolase of the HAD superfamily